MPGMSGLELSKLLAVQAPRLPLILMTAFADTVEPMGGGFGTAIPVLRKPFDDSTLLSAIASAMGMPALADNEK
jgi:FixJ family two-component response regulator